MTTNLKTALATALCAAACCQPGLAQVAPTTILEVDTANRVQYVEDTSDVSRFATDQRVTTVNTLRNFGLVVAIGDIVAVNGQAVRGTLIQTARGIALRTAPNPGQAISDTVRDAVADMKFEILSSDSTPVGTIMASGLAVGSAPPGAPLEVTQANIAIAGGTGAFLGARGQVGQAVASQTIPVRQASITEDPANRRTNGGGTGRFVLHVIPMAVPQIIAGAAGPAVTHSSDFTLVTSSKPAAGGEILSLFATGLGPTVPGVNPGQSFPSSPQAVVNSPVQVTVNGKPAQVFGAVGFPGAVDGYQVNFQIPPDATKGVATIQLSAAWIVGPSVNIPIQ